MKSFQQLLWANEISTVQHKNAVVCSANYNISTKIPVNLYIGINLTVALFRPCPASISFDGMHRHLNVKLNTWPLKKLPPCVVFFLVHCG